MLILLPPSEGKTGRRRGRRLDLATLSFPELGSTRRRVAAALAEVSARPDAVTLLGVSPRLGDDVGRNLRLRSTPTLAAGRLYTGVLYDALDLAGLDTAARRRANRWIVVVSALFGAVRLTDPIVPYRLSMSVHLPGVGPLAAAWRPPLSAVLPLVAGRGMVVDCRSSTYAAAWSPTGNLAGRWVQVRVPGATHQAKHTRGLVARHLCDVGADPRNAPALAQALSEAFDTELTEPGRAGRPWLLDVRRR